MEHSHGMGIKVYAEENRDAQRAALEAVSIGVAAPRPDKPTRTRRMSTRKPGHKTRTQRLNKAPQVPIPVIAPIIIPTNAEALKMLKTGSR